MVEDSGMGETIKDPEKVQDIAKRMKDKMVELKKKHGMPPAKETAESLKLIEQETYAANEELMKELDEVMDWEVTEKMMGKGDTNLMRSKKFGVLALTNIVSFMGVVKTGKGLPGLEHNHQSIHDGKYESKTENGSDSPIAWNFNFRHFGDRDYSRTMSTVAIQNGLLFTADLSGFVYCLDAETGQHHWTYDTFAAIWASAFVADGKVYIGDEDGDLAVLEASKEKKLLYEVNMGSAVYTTPVAKSGVLYLSLIHI